jgi:hypothetical protein
MENHDIKFKKLIDHINSVVATLSNEERTDNSWGYESKDAVARKFDPEFPGFASLRGGRMDAFADRYTEDYCWDMYYESTDNELLHGWLYISLVVGWDEADSQELEYYNVFDREDYSLLTNIWIS